MKTCLRKTDKAIWDPPLSTNPPISEHFFHNPPLYPNFKNKNPLPPLKLVLRCYIYCQTEL